MLLFIVFFALQLLFETKLQVASLYVRKMLSEEVAHDVLAKGPHTCVRA